MRRDTTKDKRIPEAQGKHERLSSAPDAGRG